MDNLQLGIDALKAGKRDEARNFLADAVKDNPDDEFTWQWLYNACNSDKERYKCLEQILRINPNNEKAALLKQQLSGLDNPIPEKTVNVPKTVNPNNKNMLVGIGAILLLCFICVFIYFASLGGGKKDYKTMAYIQCQIHLQDRLKSPSSADFPASSTVNIQDSGNNIFEIRSYVDAQNSFGAQIRTPFYCKIQFIGDAKSDESIPSNWSILQLNLIE